MVEKCCHNIFNEFFWGAGEEDEDKRRQENGQNLIIFL